MSTNTMPSVKFIVFLFVLTSSAFGRVFEADNVRSYSDTPVVVKSWATTPAGITPTISGSLKPLGFTVNSFKLFREGDYVHFTFYGVGQIVDRSYRISGETENSVSFGLIRAGGSGSERFEEKIEYTMTAEKNGDVTMSGKSELKSGWLSIFGGKSDSARYTLTPLPEPKMK